jgi:uncharacterized protein YabE (DUF348 family)
MKFKLDEVKSRRKSRIDFKRLKVLSKHPFAVPVITGFCLILLTIAFVLFFGNAKQIQVTPDSKIVIITDAGVQQIVPSDDKTVGTLLKRLNISLNQGDVVQPSLTTPIDQDDFRINIYRAVPVEIVDNGIAYYSFSAATTPRAIASQVGVIATASDYVTSQPTENFLASDAIGRQVIIESGIPIVLDLYGTDLPLYVHASTVAEVMSQENIQLTSEDQVTPSLNSSISPNEQVSISRSGIKTEIVTQPIATPVQTTYVSDLAYGTSSIVQQGSPGKEVVAYELSPYGTILDPSSPIQTIVTVPPVTEIVDEGDSLSGIQGDMSLAGISPADYSYVDFIVSHESGWCPTKWQGEIGYCPAGFSQLYANDDDVGYGLCQSTPPDKMAEFGADWQTDPITQLEWCDWYAQMKFGGWYNAYIHWIDYGNW